MLRYVMPVVIGLVYVGLNSFVPEPHRRRLNALIVTGAGAAYISGGGFGLWELAFCALLVAVGYAALNSYTLIGIGWLLHTAWDVMHHRRGTPLIPSLHDSSFGCAICDPVIALWCFVGGPSIKDLYHRFSRRRAADAGRPAQPVTVTP
ncbi:DUF6010 family protein [Micromonospora sp. NPDC000668]|uniref:DUF6010 family protein n=1 Tax=Micromonospora sp. NPDC000668 TaxID=3364219 RepID=UPI0036BF99B3